MIDKKLMFVHIPKTGGTSVTFALKSKLSWNRPAGSKFNHEPLFLLDKVNNLSDFFIFAVARNPYTRAYSYYKHYQKQTNSYPSFGEFLDHVRRKRQAVYNSYDAKIFHNETPFIIFSQSFWVFDSKGKMSLDKLYRFESLSELETDFNIKLQKMNSGSYSNDNYYVDYTQENIDLVKHIYLEDFINFKYPFDFI